MDKAHKSAALTYHDAGNLVAVHHHHVGLRLGGVGLLRGNGVLELAMDGVVLPGKASKLNMNLTETGNTGNFTTSKMSPTTKPKDKSPKATLK